MRPYVGRTGAHQLMAAGFLSQHMFPDSPRTSMSEKGPLVSISSTAFTPLDTMFMPMASPVAQRKRA